MQANQARLLIRQHISKHGRKKDVHVTEKMIRYWWRIINIAVFYGRLPQPSKIHLPAVRLGGKMADSYAYLHLCDCDGIKCTGICLGIQPTFPTKRVFLIVLAHEMVHGWQRVHHGTDGHSKRFFAWQKRIKDTIGLPLDIAVSTKE